MTPRPETDPRIERLARRVVPRVVAECRDRQLPVRSQYAALTHSSLLGRTNPVDLVRVAAPRATSYMPLSVCRDSRISEGRLIWSTLTSRRGRSSSRSGDSAGVSGWRCRDARSPRQSRRSAGARRGARLSSPAPEPHDGISGRPRPRALVTRPAATHGPRRPRARHRADPQAQDPPPEGRLARGRRETDA
jgi:hypothetical protein